MPTAHASVCESAVTLCSSFTSSSPVFNGFGVGVRTQVPLTRCSANVFVTPLLPSYSEPTAQTTPWGAVVTPIRSSAPGAPATMLHALPFQCSSSAPSMVAPVAQASLWSRTATDPSEPRSAGGIEGVGITFQDEPFQRIANGAQASPARFPFVPTAQTSFGPALDIAAISPSDPSAFGVAWTLQLVPSQRSRRN